MWWHKGRPWTSRGKLHLEKFIESKEIGDPGSRYSRPTRPRSGIASPSLILSSSWIHRRTSQIDCFFRESVFIPRSVLFSYVLFFPSFRYLCIIYKLQLLPNTCAQLITHRRQGWTGSPAALWRPAHGLNDPPIYLNRSSCIFIANVWSSWHFLLPATMDVVLYLCLNYSIYQSLQLVVNEITTSLRTSTSMSLPAWEISWSGAYPEFHVPLARLYLGDQGLLGWWQYQTAPCVSFF